MKILGLSFGRKMKNCEILVKEALLGAEKKCIETKFISCIDLDIQHCRACGVCGKRMQNGKEPKCIIDDDYQKIEDAVLEADGIILAAPVYVLAPVGQLKNFIDRFGPMHDMASMKNENKRRKKEGISLLDEKFFKRRKIGFISLGGAITENWVSMGMLNLKLFGLSTQMIPVDEMDLYDMGRNISPVLNEGLIQRANTLGRNISEAIIMKSNEIRWKGDYEGVCPICHSRTINIKEGTIVECPVCGIEGELAVQNNKIKVVFSETQKKKSRYRIEGLEDHYEEINKIKNHVIKTYPKKIEEIHKKLKRYK